ncbi:MAG: uracil-xanthine permease [Methanobrevibacter sp.]|nr:uracil-xanthine permease [Methanobrevibacter sp.]
MCDMMSEENSNMLLGVRDKPPALNWVLLAIQHVCAMFGATILVPIVVNTTAGADVLSIPVALVSSGLGTLIYLICTRGRSPVYLGSSFAFIAPMIAGYAIAGKASVFTALMIVGLVYVVISLIIRISGKAWINRLLPPVIVGPMIMVIGLSLAPTAISEIGLDLDIIPWQNLIVALIAFLTTAFLAVRGKGILRVIPFLVGIIVGYIVAALLGMVDFTGVMTAQVIAVPEFYLPFMHYDLNFAAILTIVPIALVTMVEHIGDHKVLSEIIGRDLIEDPGLDRTLLGDGLATFLAAFLGGPANTTYGENTSVVGMTRVASVYVIGLAAIIAIIFAFSGHLTALLTAIPAPVLGGISVLLYGFICVNGLKILIHNQVDFNNTKNVVVAATMLVLGLGGATLSVASGDLSIAISGMSLAAIVGIILNLCIPEEKHE